MVGGPLKNGHASPMGDYTEEIYKNAGPDGSKPPEKKRPRYVIRDAAYALQPKTPVEYIIEPIVRPGTPVLLVGDAGKYKTFIVLSMGVCVAAGKKWLNFQTRHSRVLIVDEENGDDIMRDRLGDMLRGELADDTAAIEFVSMARFNLRDPKEAVLLQALIEKRNARMVIVDALMDLMPGADENTVKDVLPVFMRLRKIADDTGAAIVIIHHSNRGGSYRGSSAIKGLFPGEFY